MQDSFEFKLSEPFKVQAQVKGKNEFIDLDTIYLKCFNIKEHRNITLRLRNKYKRMMISNINLIGDLAGNKEASSSDDSTLDAHSIKESLSICDDNDLIEFHEKFMEFLSKDVCFKDEDLEKKLTTNDIANIDLDDLEGVIAKYIEVFFISSWMKSTK